MAMPTISLADAKLSLDELLDRVAMDGTPLKVLRDGSPPVAVMSLDHYYSIDETAFLLSTPANEESMRRALEQDRRGEGISFDSIEEAFAAVMKTARKAS